MAGKLQTGGCWSLGRFATGRAREEAGSLYFDMLGKDDVFPDGLRGSENCVGAKMTELIFCHCRDPRSGLHNL